MIRYLHAIMGVLYIVLGIMVFVYPILPEMSETTRNVVAAALVVYGFIRLFRFYKS